jgi:RNA polymerase sigma-70 factor (ECF subfamily)
MANELAVDKQITQLDDDKLEPGRWVDLYADYLYGYTFKRLNEDELARDLVWETFLVALAKTESSKEIALNVPG